MYPLKSIVDFMLTGVSRIPAEERIDALCSMFAGLLPDMTAADIAAARQQVVVRFWNTPEVASPVLDLIDGHVALRGLLQGITLEDDEDESTDYDL